MSRPRELPSERAETALRALVSGLAPDDPLPSIRELSEQYGVSRSTIARALRKLADEGLIVTRQGWGAHKAT